MKKDNRKIIEIISEQDFKDLNRKFFEKKDFIDPHQMMLLMKSIQSKTTTIKDPDQYILNHSRNKEIIKIIHGDESIKIQIIVETNMTNGKKIRTIRRLAKNPGLINYFNLEQEEFKAIARVFSKSHTGFSDMDDIVKEVGSPAFIEKFYHLYANAPCIFLSQGSKRFLAYYNSRRRSFRRVKQIDDYKEKAEKEVKKTQSESQAIIPVFVPANDAQCFGLAFVTNPDFVDVLIEGPGGSGKSSIAVYAALFIDKLCKIIRIIRPTKEGGEELGYRKGWMAQKLGPFVMAIRDILYDFFGLKEEEYPIEITEEQQDNSNNGFNGNDANKKIEKKTTINGKRIIIDPPNFLQGRNLKDRIIIGDEFQNINEDDGKTIISRGYGHSRYICVGDFSKYQNKIRKSCFLNHIERLTGMQNVACIRLPQCLRSEFFDEAQRYL